MIVLLPYFFIQTFLSGGVFFGLIYSSVDFNTGGFVLILASIFSFFNIKKAILAVKEESSNLNKYQLLLISLLMLILPIFFFYLTLMH